MFAEGNYPLAIENFEHAYELAQRFGDRDTQMLALAGKGCALMKSGEVAEGLELLDEGTLRRSAASSSRIRRLSSMMKISCARMSAPSVGPPSGRKRRTAGATGWT